MSSRKNNMPNINNLPKYRRNVPTADLKKTMRNSGSTRSSPLTTNELGKLLRNSGSSPSSPTLSSQFSINLDAPLLTTGGMQHFLNVPRAKKNAPSPKKVPSPQRMSSPDRKFSHLHEGTNSGEKDSMGRVIWHGPRGGKFVISTIGKRVPYVNDTLKSKVNNHKMESTGVLDRKERMIYKGKSGGRFVITDTGRRANPLY
jgi:hypothetical protein